MTNFMVLGPGTALPDAVKVVVNPSASMLGKGTLAKSDGSLSLKRCALSTLLTVLMETSSLLPGTNAMFSPLRNQAKTSLKGPPTNSLYSSDPQTYSNWMGHGFLVHSKVNSRTQASAVSPSTIASRSASPSAPFWLDARSVLCKCREAGSPVLITTPVSGKSVGTAELPPVKRPAQAGFPVMVASLKVTN